MTNFSREAKAHSERVNRSIADITERLEKDTAELVAYLNDEVIPAVRAHSTSALRVASEKLSRMADYLDQKKRS